MIWIQNQLVGAALTQNITLECQSEAYPKSINYWMKNDTIIVPGKLFNGSETSGSYVGIRCFDKIEKCVKVWPNFMRV